MIHVAEPPKRAEPNPVSIPTEVPAQVKTASDARPLVAPPSVARSQRRTMADEDDDLDLEIENMNLDDIDASVSLMILTHFFLWQGIKPSYQ